MTSSGGATRHDLRLDTLQYNDAYAFGGGIENFGTLSVAETYLVQNVADDNGGGINNNGWLTLFGNQIVANYAGSRWGRLLGRYLRQ